MSEWLKKTVKSKFVRFALILTAVTICAVILAAKAAEETGVYWIGMGDSTSNEEPEDSMGFFTVDVSDFINDNGAAGDENAISEDTELIPLAIGPLAGVTALTDEEIKLYGVLSKNDGVISQSGNDELNEDMHWTEVVLEQGETVASVAKEFGISEEDLRIANGLSKKQKANPSDVLYVPDSHKDVQVTLQFVKKLQQEEFTLAKNNKRLEIIQYEIKEGDTLWGLANKFDLDVDTLIGSNRQILNGNIDHLKLGAKLRIPNQDGIFVKVRKGDTVTALANKHGSTKAAVFAANELKAAPSVGAEIFLPGGKLVAVTEVKIAVKRKDGRIVKSTVKLSKGRGKGGGRFRWPVLGQISSPYGWRKSPFNRRRRVFHAGIDIRAPRGTPIRAGAGGVVVHSGWMSGYGKTIVISHSNGLTTLYGHCSRLIARRGASVSGGQTIALVGSTGRSTGNHVHFEVRSGGSARNPMGYLR